MMICGKELAELKKAGELLEKDSIAVRMANLFGDAAEGLIRCLPRNYRKRVEEFCIVALEKSWEFSITTMSAPDILPEPERRHRGYAILSGAIGGAGIISLFAELPVTTVIMMRSIADVAKSQGEDFRQSDTKLACLQAFALGGDVKDIHTGETGYYASRTLLEKPLDESTRYIAKKGAAGMGAPFAVQLLAKIAVRYQTFLAAKAAADIVPVAGAIMGAVINIIFIDYFHDKAQGHFIVRRLERKYGADQVRQEYLSLETDVKAAQKVSVEETDKIIRRHVYAAMGMGLIPVPVLDFIGITGILLNLLAKLARAYHIPFSKDRAKNLIGALMGGAFPSSAGVWLGGSVAKIIPGIGQTIGIVTVSASAGASAYAVGKVFSRHFAQGGTFLSFDPEAARAFYEEMFKEGQEIAAELKSQKSKKTGDSA